MKYLSYFYLASVVSLAIGSSAQAFEASCIQTQVESGDSCNNLRISFDFTGCDTVHATEVVRSTCVNQKAVAVVKIKDARYIATYASPLRTGEHWRFLTIRKELRAGAATTATSSAMTIQIKKQTDTTGIEKEDVETMAKPAPALVVLPSAVGASGVSTPATPSIEPAKTASVEPSKEFPVVEKATVPEPESKQTAAVVEEKVAAEISKLQWSGFLDFYYMQDTNNPPPVAQPATSNPPAGNVKYRAFDVYNDTFSLSLAELTLKKEVGSLGGQVDLGFGNTTLLISPQDAATRNFIQAFAYWKITEQWRVTVGKVATHISLEGDYATENFNYSHSLLYTFAIPTWQTGVSLDYSGKSLGAGIFAYNGWAGPYQTGQKTAGLRLRAHNDAWSFQYTGMVSTQPMNSQGSLRQIHDGNLLWKINKQAAVGLDAVWGSQTTAYYGQDATWASGVLSGKYTWGRYTLAPRIEYYMDPNGYSVNGGSGSSTSYPYAAQNLWSATLTNWWEIQEGARVLFELRDDISDQALSPFVDQNGYATASQLTGTIAFLYEF
jgi:hypothetical protein